MTGSYFLLCILYCDMQNYTSLLW